MTTHLSDNGKFACNGNTPNMDSKDCGCGCGGKNKNQSPSIVVNVGSNNKEGYNTLNPGSIDKTVIAYPAGQRPAITGTANSSVVAQSPIVRAKPDNVLVPTTYPAKQIKVKHIFHPEFL